MNVFICKQYSCFSQSLHWHSANQQNVVRHTVRNTAIESVEEDEVGLSRNRTDVEVDYPVDDVKRAEQQREDEARVAVDGAGQRDARRHRCHRGGGLDHVDAARRRRWTGDGGGRTTAEGRRRRRRIHAAKRR